MTERNKQILEAAEQLAGLSKIANSVLIYEIGKLGRRVMNITADYKHLGLPADDLAQCWLALAAADNLLRIVCDLPSPEEKGGK